MNPAESERRPSDRIGRRRAIAAIALAAGALAASARARGDGEPVTKESPSAPENAKRTSIHQEVEIQAPAPRIYGALLDARQFAAFSGRAAEIDAREGGAFSLFGGLIVGRNIELVAGERVVQAWRPTHWEPGIFSIARFELTPKGAGTTVVFDHTGFPEGEYDHLLSGWNGHYWGPLAKFLA